MRKHYSLRYFTKQAMTGLWRNGVMSVASVAVLMSCLVVLGCFALLLININVNLENVAQLNQIVVYCEYDLDADAIEGIGAQIEEMDYIDSVTHVTKETLREQSGEYEALYSDITPENNPLSDSFEIIYKGTDETEVFDLEAQLRSIEGVRKINSVYQVAKTLDSLKNGVMLVCIWFLVILFVVSIFVIINTIKLAVYSRRSEISVMRYVGRRADRCVCKPYWICNRNIYLQLRGKNGVGRFADDFRAWLRKNRNSLVLRIFGDRCDYRYNRKCGVFAEVFEVLRRKIGIN